MAIIRVLLTFDDGPHDAPLGGANRTEKILDTLRQRCIKAAFFIQTHVSYRLRSPNGYRIAAQTHSEGHVLAIHTGSLVDHRCHKWRCIQPPDIIGAINGLDADMKRARAAIKALAGDDPRFVRATYGYTDTCCMVVYARNNLKHIYWDVDSGDASRSPTADSICLNLEDGTRRVPDGTVELIYLFHDLAGVTAEHLDDFIDVIGTAISDKGHVPLFVRERIEVEAVMERKSRHGTDRPCPADSME